MTLYMSTGFAATDWKKYLRWRRNAGAVAPFKLLYSR